MTPGTVSALEISFRRPLASPGKVTLKFSFCLSLARNPKFPFFACVRPKSSEKFPSAILQS